MSFAATSRGSPPTAGVPDEVAVAGRERGAQRVVDGRRVDLGGRVHAYLACQDELVELAGLYALHSASHRGLEVLGRRRARHLWAHQRIRVEQRHRRGLQRLHSRAEALEHRVGRLVAVQNRRDGDLCCLATAGQRDLRHEHLRGRQ
jgi:hypothetical protein